MNRLLATRRGAVGSSPGLAPAALAAGALALLLGTPLGDLLESSMVGTCADRVSAVDSHWIRHRQHLAAGAAAGAVQAHQRRRHRGHPARQFFAGVLDDPALARSVAGRRIVAWAKYASLVGLVGIPLALSWPRLHPIAKAFVMIELLGMLLRLGWLYIISPQRFCNSYLLTDQIELGRGFIALALALAVAWLAPVFFERKGAASQRV